MPGFSFKPVAKPVKKSYAESNSKYNIIAPGIEGVVFINIKGEYNVHVGEDIYNICSESYSCKGVSEIYELALTDDLVRVRHIRSERDRDDRDRSMYLPFTAGCSVKGNIVRFKAAGTILFKIKKVYVDVDDVIAKKAIKFYRDNYNKIRKAINSNMIDNYIPTEDQDVNKDIEDIESVVNDIFSIVPHGDNNE